MNMVEIGLASIEGLALIASPCILPVLPLVLAASVEGGKRRPFGIIIGFVLAFSVFAIAARQLVAALGVDLDVIKNASLVLLALFGLVLLSAKLSARFSAWTQGAANVGNQLAMSRGEGLLSGIVIGALIGLVWTPCAGPILAAVLVQVIRQQSDFAGYLIIVSFAFGAGIPMLLIALTGRRLLGRLGFITRHAETVRKVFGVLILLSVAYIASGFDAQTLLSTEKKSASPRGELLLQDGLNQPYAAPEFAGVDAWLNSQPLTMQSLKGKVVLVDFWTYSCINCVRTLPYLTEWDKKYREQGLVIVGVHAPEFEFEKKRDNVAAAIAQHGIHYPVALDNRLATWDNFHNQYWPAHYLIDATGKVVYAHFGEGKYDETENNIRYLLGLKDKVAPAAAASEFSPNQTAETYLGHARAQNFDNVVQRDVTRAYRFPSALAEDHWALSGQWQVQAEKIVAQQSGAALRFHFNASKVFLVLGTTSGKPLHLTLKLNGQPAGEITVDKHTLYPLIDQKLPGTGLLEFTTDAPGLEAYAFTFG
ncbi:MAG: cytochrome c biogenesis protein DipZ [Gallionella sp.]|nr:cytochrome c biogenesis protein DipZ [Gallionella sp.]MDD4946764.1 cytochrome c biogenesis protein DipZ [Gallionella sp.]